MIEWDYFYSKFVFFLYLRVYYWEIFVIVPVLASYLYTVARCEQFLNFNMIVKKFSILIIINYFFGLLKLKLEKSSVLIIINPTRLNPIKPVRLIFCFSVWKQFLKDVRLMFRNDKEQLSLKIETNEDNSDKKVSNWLNTLLFWRN